MALVGAVFKLYQHVVDIPTAITFEKKLLLFIVLSIAGGILLGFTSPGAAQSLKRYINFTLYLMGKRGDNVRTVKRIGETGSK